MRPRVRTYIPGLDDDILRGGVPQGHVVLLRGGSGTMKSSMAYYSLYRNAQHGVPGLYVTLEQSAGSLLEHVASLGLQATTVSERLPVLDLSRGREQLEQTALKVASLASPSMSTGDALLTALKSKLTGLRTKLGYELLVIDSWDALELILDFQDPRTETFSFFEWLRDLGVTSFLISEEPAADAPTDVLDVEFLADGILHLTMVPVTETSFQRRLQCTKMRSVNQNSDEHTLLFENAAFEIARAIG